jgi:hypothetical protein
MAMQTVLLIAVNVVLLLGYVFVLIPVLKRKMAENGYNTKLAYLSLVPIVFIGVWSWYFVAPNAPTQEEKLK